MCVRAQGGGGAHKGQTEQTRASARLGRHIGSQKNDLTARCRRARLPWLVAGPSGSRVAAAAQIGSATRLAFCLPPACLLIFLAK